MTWFEEPGQALTVCKTKETAGSKDKNNFGSQLSELKGRPSYVLGQEGGFCSPTAEAPPIGQQENELMSELVPSFLAEIADSLL